MHQKTPNDVCALEFRLKEGISQNTNYFQPFRFPFLVCLLGLNANSNSQAAKGARIMTFVSG